MDTFTIEWKRAAEKELRQISSTEIPKMVEVIESLAQNPLHYATADFDARTLGRVRSQMRKELSAELGQIDALVEALLNQS